MSSNSKSVNSYKDSKTALQQLDVQTASLDKHHLCKYFKLTKEVPNRSYKEEIGSFYQTARATRCAVAAVKEVKVTLIGYGDCGACLREPFLVKTEKENQFI